MRGLDENESRRIFKEAQKRLERKGFDTVNPWETEDLKKQQCKDWGDFIIYDLHILKQCDAIFLLSNWTESMGAQCERAFAIGQGLQVIYGTAAT